jgi:2-C-methyl-D-erythritol 2,4-cyclodiphosphate synthase
VILPNCLFVAVSQTSLRYAMGIKMRIGTGYDVHRLVEGRALIIGGVNIPYEKGLLGHSDADVLIHAIMDALLGAAALGDIGKHFPDSEEAYKGISSIELLKKVKDLIEDQLYVIENIDATIIAQQPKMAAYIPQMVTNIASALGVDNNCINIKATTEEGLGFTGEGLGISSQASCLLATVENYSYDDRMESPNGGKNCSGCSGCSGCSHKSE